MNWKSHLRSLRTRGERPVRYVFAGILNTVFGLSIYPALLWAFPYFREHYMQGLAIVQPVGLIFSFATQKIGVFRTSLNNVISEFFKYLSFYLAYYVLNWGSLPILVEVVHIPPVIAQSALQMIAIVGGYFWHSRVTFGGEKATGHP